MSLQERTRGGIRKRLFRVFMRLLHIIPGREILAGVPGIRKTYIWLFRFIPYEVMVEVQGSTMYIAPAASGVELSLFLYRHYEKVRTNVFYQLIKRGMTVVDLGAHIGYHTLIAAKLVGPEGKVFAFEPEPRNFRCLQRNVELNGYTNVTLVQKAASNKIGIAKFYLDSASWGHSLSSIKRTAGAVSVSVTSLDEFFPEDMAIDFIKINIEGAEGRAVQGMERILSKGGPKAIMIDFHLEEMESQGSSFKEIWDKLTPFGFEFYEMRGDATRRVNYQEALHLAEKQGGGCHLLCMRK